MLIVCSSGQSGTMLANSSPSTCGGSSSQYGSFASSNAERSIAVVNRKSAARSGADSRSNPLRETQGNIDFHHYV